MKREINASVHDIVDFVYAQGDIVPAFASKTDMQEGTVIHINVQNQYNCDKEVFVKYDGDYHDYHITLQGRIDLLNASDGKFELIEIKSCASFENLDENTYRSHFAQAYFYGFMLYEYKKLDKRTKIVISVMYVHKYNYAKKFFSTEFTYTELETFFFETLDEYIRYRNVIEDWQLEKLDSISALVFPYEYRSGQMELVDAVFKTVEEKGELFVCAPTGIGKSLGTIYPSVKSLISKQGKIFYLTSKSMIKDIARNAVAIMRAHSGLKLKTLSLTAKEKICMNDKVKCNPKDCMYARGFFSRVNEASLDIFRNEDDLNYDNISRYAEKYQICPFEFQLNLSLISDMIICDYNYVFDPRVYLRRFFDFDTRNLILLIDEAHNMYDRVCSMYTQGISYRLIETVGKYTTPIQEIESSCSALISKLSSYHRHLSEHNKKALKFADLDMGLLDEAKTLVSRLEKYFDKLHDREEEIPEELLDSYFELVNFQNISDYYDEDFVIWTESKPDAFNYQITCLNPRKLIRMRKDHVLASVFFSATLHPSEYYMSVLGAGKDASRLSLESPFDQHRLNLLINTRISTKYANREMTKYQVAYQIDDLIREGGKYLVYFPSYEYLDIVYKTFSKVSAYTGEILLQSRSMSERERGYFISRFDESDKNIVGFAVLGGVFAEGIDLKGEKLNGVVVVGVGLPLFDDFRNELRAYFEAVYQRGYQYAYVYPGFNKVMQAVGRVIRDEDDRGTALLIDERYATNEYLRIFPQHWSHYEKL